jgi:hypothetical protein
LQESEEILRGLYFASYLIADFMQRKTQVIEIELEEIGYYPDGLTLFTRKQKFTHGNAGTVVLEHGDVRYLRAEEQ